jgi:hypothetical protein
MKNLITSSGIEPTTFLLVAYCHNHLRNRMPPAKCYYSHKIKEDEMGGTCSTYGQEVPVGKPEGRRPLGRHSHVWEDNINIYLKKQDGCELN